MTPSNCRGPGARPDRLLLLRNPVARNRLQTPTPFQPMNSSPTPIPRRKFLASTATILTLAPLAYLRGQQGSPNDEIAMGIIGCGGQGVGNMKNFLGIKGVRVVAVC